MSQSLAFINLVTILSILGLIVCLNQLISDGLFLVCLISPRSHGASQNKKLPIAIAFASILARIIIIGATVMSFFPREHSGKGSAVFPAVLTICGFLPFHLASWLCGFKKLLYSCLRSNPSKLSMGASEPLLSAEAEPMILIIIPCYNEQLGTILETLDSIRQFEYPTDKIHVFLSFDGFANRNTFQALVDQFRSSSTQCSDSASATGTFPVATCLYHGFEVTMSMHEHGGKPHVQGRTLEYIRKHHPAYMEAASRIFVLLLDSDTILDPGSLRHLIFTMYTQKLSRAITSVQGIKRKSVGPNGAFQEVDYFYEALHFQTVASTLGGAICLSGTVTFCLLRVLLQVPEPYFSSQVQHQERNDIREYWTCVFGDDRWLTQLIASQTFAFGATDIDLQVICSTEAAQFPTGLISQRRRWLLGSAATEALALGRSEYWVNYPALSFYRFCFQTLRVPPLQMLLLAAVMVLRQDMLAWMFFCIVFGTIALDFVMYLSYGYVHGRSSVLLFPIYVCLFPLLVMLPVRVLALLTMKNQTWGGPRSALARGN